MTGSQHCPSKDILKPQPSLAPSQEKTKTRSWRCQLFHTGGRVQNAPNFQKFATIQPAETWLAIWLSLAQGQPGAAARLGVLYQRPTRCPHLHQCGGP